MLEQSKAFSGFTTDNIDKTEVFYREILGLTVERSPGPYGMLTLKLGNGADVLIYPKPDHQPAGYTVLNFPVADIEAAVDELASKGVTTEKYSGDMGTDEKGIFRKGGPLIAWFKDPSGNILSVIQSDS